MIVIASCTFSTNWLTVLLCVYGLCEVPVKHQERPYACPQSHRLPSLFHHKVLQRMSNVRGGREHEVCWAQSRGGLVEALWRPAAPSWRPAAPSWRPAAPQGSRGAALSSARGSEGTAQSCIQKAQGIRERFCPRGRLAWNRLPSRCVSRCDEKHLCAIRVT